MSGATPSLVDYWPIDGSDNRIVRFSTNQVCSFFDRRFETETKTCVWCRASDPKTCTCSLETWKKICPDQWAVDCYCRTEEDRPGKPESPIPKIYITDLAEAGREDYTPEMHEQRLKTVQITRRKTSATEKTESTLE
jgi:hypothetical protein